jgi:hypothetical protein
MLRIESLEIDDHILDKIETKYGITLEEVEEGVYRIGGMSEEAGKGCISFSARRKPGGTFW